MSVFPKRIVAGGEVVVHFRRVCSSLPAVEFIRIVIVSPKGKRFVLTEREIYALKPKAKRRRQRLSKAQSREVLQIAPPAVFAEYLSQDDAGLEWFLDFFEESKFSSHWYKTFKTNAKAVPGKYEVHLECYSNGQLLNSGTRSFDHFFIDKMKVENFFRQGAYHQLSLRNLSSEITPVTIYQIVQGKRVRPQKIQLASGQLFETRVRSEKVFISYFSENEILRVSSGGQPFVQRNLRYLYDLDQKKSGYLTIENKNKKHSLDHIASKIWEKADGFQLRSELRNKKNKRIYDWMLSERIIIEKHPVNSLKD